MQMANRKNPHPVRQLRDALSALRGHKVTQAAFAKELGISPALINALETKASRPISEDFKQRIAMRYGVGIDEKQRKAFNLSLPHKPLLEAMAELQGRHEAVDLGALVSFEHTILGHIRVMLWAAYKRKKAAICVEVLRRRIHELADEMQLGSAFDEADIELAETNFQFPEHILASEAGLQYFAEHMRAVLRSQGASLPPRLIIKNNSDVPIGPGILAALAKGMAMEAGAPFQVRTAPRASRKKKK